MVKKLPVIEFIFKEKNKLKKKTEKEIEEVVNIWIKLEKKINQLIIKKMKDDERKIICKYFKDDTNKVILIDIFGQNVYDDFRIKINDFLKTKKVIQPEIKKEEKKKKNSKDKEKNKEKETQKKEGNLIKPTEDINVNNIKIIYKPNDPFNYFKNDSFTLNKKSIEEISTTSESIIDIDLQAPKPRIRKDRERTNISEIENNNNNIEIDSLNYDKNIIEDKKENELEQKI